MPKNKANATSLDEQWKVHIPNLFREIAENSKQPIFTKPLQITMNILREVATRAAQLNDPQLNALMCRLTMYTIADPTQPDYNPKRVAKILRQARR